MRSLNSSIFPMAYYSGTFHSSNTEVCFKMLGCILILYSIAWHRLEILQINSCWTVSPTGWNKTEWPMGVFIICFFVPHFCNCTDVQSVASGMGGWVGCHPRNSFELCSCNTFSFHVTMFKSHSTIMTSKDIVQNTFGTCPEIRTWLISQTNAAVREGPSSWRFPRQAP